MDENEIQELNIPPPQLEVCKINIAGFVQLLSCILILISTSAKIKN